MFRFQWTACSNAKINDNARKGKADFIMNEEQKMLAPGYINKSPTFMKEMYILDWGMKKNTALKLLGHSQSNNMRYKMRANKTGDLEIYDSEQD